jgi:hypothetical protein
MDNFIFWILPKQQHNGLENQRNLRCMAQVMQGVEETLRRVNQFAVI